MTRSEDAAEPPEIASGMEVDGRYVLSHVLAERPHGTLWAASLQTTGQSVVLKALDVDHVPDVEQRRVLQARFEREITQTGRLAHPHIPRLVDHGTHPRLGRYAVLERYDGRTLREHLDTDGPMAPMQAARLMAQILDALSYAHAMGVAHRDVRPGNVMVTARDHAVLLDLGIAGLLTAPEPGHGRPGGEAPRAGLGYVAYAAPERLEGTELTGQSDIYAWALTFVELVDGQPLVGGTAPEKVARHRDASAHPLPDSVPHWLRPVLAKACAKPLAQRFSTAAEALSALEGAMAGVGPAVVGRSSWRWALIGLLALVAALTGGYLLWTSGPEPDAVGAADGVSASPSSADTEVTTGADTPAQPQRPDPKADPPTASGTCPFERSAHLPVGGQPEPLRPSAAVWMAPGGRHLRLVVPRFSATFMSVATAQLALHDPDGAYGLGVYEGRRSARLELADFRKRSMAAVSTPTEASLIARVEVHERLSHRVCLTVAVSGIVAFKLQLVAAIVERDAKAILMNQGIHRRLQYWEPTDGYRIMQRADGLGGFCPLPGKTLVEYGRRLAGKAVSVGRHAEGLELVAQAPPRGTAHAVFERPAGDGAVRLKRAWFRPDANTNVGDVGDRAANGGMQLFTTKEGYCGELELKVGSDWLWMVFSGKGAIP